MDMKLPDRARILLYWIVLAVAFAFAAVFVVRLQGPEKPFVDYMEAGLAAYNEKDYDKALFFFLQGDREDNPEASFSLGAMYMAGYGVEKNTERALELYQNSAGFGYPPAELTLAIFYAEGQIIPQDKEKAAEYAQNAAMAGDLEAQLLLAAWNEKGFLGETNMEQAVRWYKMAALNGSADAKMALALIYHHGRKGIPANIYTAKRWYKSLENQKQFENILAGKPPLPTVNEPFMTPVNLNGTLPE